MDADLAAFLQARLDEDQALAGLQWPGPWHLSDEHDSVLGQDDITIVEAVVCSSNQARNTARYVARYSPARVLAEVDAKRHIIADLLDERHDWNEEDHWYSCAAIVDNEGEPLCLDASRAGGPCDCGRDRRVERRLKILALPFAAHPNYRPEWTPEG